MKKIISMLLVLCLLCAGAVALAEAPSFDDMPAAVIEDDDTTIEEASFLGSWVVNNAFVSTDYIDLEALASQYGLSLSGITIGDGKVIIESTNEAGEPATEEYSYVFDAGQIQSTDTDGVNFAFDLLVDGNIVLSWFLEGMDFSFFLVPAGA